jgi:hypothetical protein
MCKKFVAQRKYFIALPGYIISITAKLLLKFYFDLPFINLGPGQEALCIFIGVALLYDIFYWAFIVAVELTI